MATFPIRIENGHGETLVFERLVATPDGDRLEGTNEVEPGVGPPMHVHFKQEEGMTVVAGRLGYEIAGEPPRYAGVGESVVFAAGVAHRFWADGDERLLCDAYIQPADNSVDFLAEIFRSQRANGGRPHPFDVAYLLHKYRDEYAILGIPAFVTNVVFPALRLIGRLTGRYRELEHGPATL